MPNTPPSTPGLQALADTWFSVTYHLEGLGTAAARAEQFLRAWDEIDRTPVVAIPEHTIWRLP